MDDDGQVSGPWDHVAVQLQAWRRTAGDPSYADIASRITAARIARGTEPAAARVGRTTVYDAFRLGRARINHALVREIASALGAAEDEVDALLTGPAPVAEVPPAPAPDPVPASPAPTGAHVVRRGRRWALAVALGCVALNLLGRVTVDFLGVPVYLDMVGTALAAIVLGPWHAAGVGVVTNLAGVPLSGWDSAAFTPVNVLGGLIWGYGVHRFGMGRTMARFFVLSAAAGVACSLMAAPTLYLLGGSIGHGQDDLTASMLALTHQFGLALGLGNLLTSLADKLLSGFVGMVGASVLGVQIATEPPQRRRDGVSPSLRARHGATTG
jgi:energy-coupling factor transport system substrate-specific component